MARPRAEKAVRIVAMGDGPVLINVLPRTCENLADDEVWTIEGNRIFSVASGGREWQRLKIARPTIPALNKFNIDNRSWT